MHLQPLGILFNRESNKPDFTIVTLPNIYPNAIFLGGSINFGALIMMPLEYL